MDTAQTTPSGQDDATSVTPEPPPLREAVLSGRFVGSRRAEEAGQLADFLAERRRTGAAAWFGTAFAAELLLNAGCHARRARPRHRGDRRADVGAGRRHPACAQVAKTGGLLARAGLAGRRPGAGRAGEGSAAHHLLAGNLPRSGARRRVRPKPPVPPDLRRRVRHAGRRAVRPAVD